MTENGGHHMPASAPGGQVVANHTLPGHGVAMDAASRPALEVLRPAGRRPRTSVLRHPVAPWSPEAVAAPVWLVQPRPFAF